MVDYRRFLQKPQLLALPWLGGSTLDARDRRLRITGALPAKYGWYQFSVLGRDATLVAACEAADCSTLPKVRGWLFHERLFLEGAVVEGLFLPPDEEPPAFSPVVTRRWATGVLLFEGLEFETEVEGAVREALGDRRPLGTLKGVAAPLRAAYGLALLDRVSRELGVRFSVQEVRLALGPVGLGGEPVARQTLEALEAERVLARRELAERERRLQQQLVRAEVEVARQRLIDERAHRDRVDVDRRAHAVGAIEERAEAALSAAGATLESLRRLRNDQLEVVFKYSIERFIAVVDARTLQVIDSGICLGHPPRDDLITLESLPGVIQEAMDTGALVILRWP